MVTMIDVLPATTVLAVGNLAIVAAIALVVGFAWLVRGTAAELRRMAAEERRHGTDPEAPAHDATRLAA